MSDPTASNRPLAVVAWLMSFTQSTRICSVPAAIKVLKASLADDETSLQRFLNEARSAAQLVHSNIVQVYDVGRDGDIHFIAQEFIAGTNLRQFLAPTPSEDDRQPSTDAANQDDRQLPLPEALSILLQVLAALEKSAARGIVHRDIKPENIMLTADGVVKVTDFGLARTYLGDDPKLTRAGTTLGTPMYMSPEQIQDGAVDIRSDLYSLGVTLYHMLAGRPPFKGETQLALAMMHTQADVPDIRRFRHDIPESLCELLDRLLQKDPESRLPKSCRRDRVFATTPVGGSSRVLAGAYTAVASRGRACAVASHAGHYRPADRVKPAKLGVVVHNHRRCTTPVRVGRRDRDSGRIRHRVDC